MEGLRGPFGESARAPPTWSSSSALSTTDSAVSAKHCSFQYTLS